MLNFLRYFVYAYRYLIYGSYSVNSFIDFSIGTVKMRIDRETLRLENRLKRLERLVYEKTVGRGGADSRAYTIWKLLRDEGPMTRPEIRNRLGYTTPIVEMEAENCVTKSGNLYSANLDYNWEDVGAIPRTADQERAQMGPSAADIAAAMRDANNGEFDERPSRGKATRAPRQPRSARAVTPNMFSRKFAEVKQAVDNGEDVNQKNDKGKTPLMWALTSNKPDSEEIARYLIDHGANVNVGDSRNMAVISYAVKYNHPNVVRYMLDHGGEDLRINSRMSYIGAGRSNTSLLEVAAQNGWPLKDLLILIQPMFFNSVWAYELLSNVLRTYYKDSSPAEKQAFVNHCVNMHLNSVSDKDMAVSNMSGVTRLNGLEYRSIGKYFRNAIRDAGYVPYLGNMYNRSNLAGNEQEIYDIARDLISGKLKNTLSTSPFSTFLQYLGDACSALNRPSLGGDVLNQSIIDSMPNDWAWELLDDAIYDGSDSVNDMVKLKFKKPSISRMCSILKRLAESRATNSDSDRAITRQVCKLLSKYIHFLSFNPGNSSTTGFYTLNRIAESHNKYLIDFLIDCGFGQDLADSRTNNKSKECIDALFDANIIRTDDKSQDERTAMANKRSLNAFINIIIYAIEHDRMDVSLQSRIREDASVLLDPRVQEAINEADPDNITARQLRIQADRAKADEVKDTYDF